MTDVKVMDKHTVRIVQGMINSDVTSIRFVDKTGRVEHLEKSSERILIATVYRFLLDNKFLIEYVYNKYEGMPSSGLVQHKFHIIDASQISSPHNWLIDNEAIYNALIGRWDNLNSQDKNVYELGARALIKYANYVAQSYANIEKYRYDGLNVIAKFKKSIINSPTFLVNLPSQLAMVCR